MRSCTAGWTIQNEAVSMCRRVHPHLLRRKSRRSEARVCHRARGGWACLQRTANDVWGEGGPRADVNRLVPRAQRPRDAPRPKQLPPISIALLTALLSWICCTLVDGERSPLRARPWPCSPLFPILALGGYLRLPVEWLHLCSALPVPDNAARARAKMSAPHLAAPGLACRACLSIQRMTRRRRTPTVTRASRRAGDRGRRHSRTKEAE